MVADIKKPDADMGQNSKMGGRLKNLSNFYHAFWLLLTKQNQRNVMLMFIVKYLHTKKKHDP